jgi:hypothetical protein
VDETALRARLEFLEEMFRELYRRDVVTDEMLRAVADRFGSQADRASPSGAEVANHCAHMAVMLPIEAQAPTQSEWTAEQRRTRMRLISDGGNPPE